MKRIAYLAFMLCLLASCSNDESIEPAPSEDWTPQISRSVTGGEELRIVGRKDDGTDVFNSILIPAEEGGRAQWKNNKPAWKDETVNLIALSPAGDKLLTSIEHDGTTEYFVDYLSQQNKNNRPKEFNMKHLMAQLKVHIWVEETEVHQPKNDSVLIYTRANIDFPKREVKELDRRKRVNLGEFEQTATLEEDGHHYDKFSMIKPMVVLPQTIPAGEEILWFTVEDSHYYLKAEKDIQLKAGFLTSLTLHVTYVGDNNGTTEEPPTWKLITLNPSAVTITDWETAHDINGGEAEEI